jgi:hypothetical protein
MNNYYRSMCGRKSKMLLLIVFMSSKTLPILSIITIIYFFIDNRLTNIGKKNRLGWKASKQAVCIMSNSLLEIARCKYFAFMIPKFVTQHYLMATRLVGL